MTSTPSPVTRFPAKPDQPFAHPFGQGPGVGHVEAQLDRRRHLVDVLPTGPGGADEPLLDVALVDAEGSESGGNHQILYGRYFPDMVTLMRSPFGSFSFSTFIVKSMALMMPSPNFSWTIALKGKPYTCMISYRR